MATEADTTKLWEVSSGREVRTLTGYADGGIMATWTTDKVCLKQNPQFTNITLNRMRSIRYPGGGF